MKLVVDDVRFEARSVKSFGLISADGASLPPFEPGAHVVLRLPLRDGVTLERQYSIVSDSRNRKLYRIAVLCEAAGRGGSKFLHRDIGVGAVLEVSLPRNDFRLASTAGKSILIAGGIGVTPLLAMARHLVHQHAAVELHYAARTYDGIPFRGELATLLGARAHFYLTGPPGGERPDVASILAEPHSKTHVYVCGPVGLMRSVRQCAADQGWSDDHVHFESFGAKRRPGDGSISVRLARSSQTLHVGSDESILDAMLAANLFVSYDCRRGECSMCLTPVLEGQPDHRDVCLSEEERKRYMCTCVSRAVGSRLVLDL